MKYIFVLVLIAVLGGIIYSTMSRSKQPTVTLNASPVSSPAIKFSDSPESKNAFQIFPGPLSADAKNAMNGFSMQTKIMADGSTQVNISSTNPEYHNQQYTVKPGYTLYFIEKFSGDDNPATDTDRTTGDDTAVLVDPQGFIASSP